MEPQPLALCPDLILTTLVDLSFTYQRPIPFSTLYSSVEQDVGEGSKRKQFIIRDKQDLLCLLGANSDGMFFAAQIDPTTQKRWNNHLIIEKIHVAKSAVSGWRKNAVKIMAVDTTSHRRGKIVCMNCGKHVPFEDVLIRYRRESNRYMKKQTLFRADVVRTKALNVRDKPIENVSNALSADDISSADWQVLEKH